MRPGHPKRPRAERGMILVNVLLIVALAASVVVLMTSAQDLAVDRSLRLREAAEAAAIARGGELSAIAALRRSSGDARGDLRAIGAVAQRTVRVAGGSFALDVTDAQARFNLATVRVTDPGSLALALRVARAAGIQPAEMTRLAILIAANRPGDMLAAIDDRTVARLARVATILPVSTRVNANAADAALLTALAPDAATGQALIALRDRLGVVTNDDVGAANIALPPALTLDSDLYWVRCRATVGDTAQQLSTLLLRRYRSGRPEVVAIARWWGPVSPLRGPPA